MDSRRRLWRRARLGGGSSCASKPGAGSARSVGASIFASGLLTPGKVAQPDREEHRIEPTVVVRDPQIRDVPIANVEGERVLAGKENVEAAASLRAEFERTADADVVQSREHDALPALDVRHE